MGHPTVGWARGFVAGAMGWALVLGAAPPVGAQTPDALGGEFQVNTEIAYGQHQPFVAADGDGDFVVVWYSEYSYGGDADSSSIQGQRYASSGSPLGAQFQVNTYTTGYQLGAMASVAAQPDGDFVVVWMSAGSYDFDSSMSSIQGRLYASNGSPLTSDFQINTYTPYAQYHPSVAMAPNGAFIVTWHNLVGSPGTDSSARSAQGQRFASNGAIQGSQFQINTYTTGSQDIPVAGFAADGDFVVVWESAGSFGTDSSSYSIQGQRYASNGTAQGGEFQINTYTTGMQSYPWVSVASDESFVVVWSSAGSSGTDAAGDSIQARRYASNGTAIGAEFQVNTYTTGDQRHPSVVATPDGGFQVVWSSTESFAGGSGENILGQRFASDGSVLGAEFLVNTYTEYPQQFAGMAAAGSEFIVVWQSEGSSGTDDQSWSIQGQRFSWPPLALKVPSLSPSGAAVTAVLMLSAVAWASRRRA